MSTRATYQFKKTKDGQAPTTTYYIHYDGYPAGAAAYFWNMHHCVNKRGDNVDKFLRANELAEHTRSHDAHGDTEYAYTFEGDHLLAEEIDQHTESDLVTQVIFSGHYCDFINEHGSADIDNFEPIKEVQTSHYGHKQYLTRTALMAILAERVEALDKYKERGGSETDGNGSDYKKDIETLQCSLRTFDGEKGLIVNVLRPANGSDCTNNGASSKHYSFVLVDPRIDGVFEPSADIPIIRIVEHRSSKGYFYLRPDSVGDKLAMMGGNFAWSCDSRVRELMPQPLAIHDRIE